MNNVYLFRRMFPGIRRLLLITVDVILMAISNYAAFGIVFYYESISLNQSLYLTMFPVMTIIALSIFNINGLFSTTRKTYTEVMIGLFMSLFSLCMMMMAISFFLREFSYSRSILLLTVFFQFILIGLWRFFYWKIDHASMYPRNVLILGNQEEIEKIVGRLMQLPHLHDFVKYVCNGLEENLCKKVEKDIDLIVVCASLPLAEKSRIVNFCNANQKQVFLVPAFYDLFCSSVDLDKIGDIPVFRPRYLEPTLETRVFKRVFDILLSLVVLGLSWPVLVILAAAIRMDSPGPVFYSQLRSGRHERLFFVHKFRTMYQDAEKMSGPVMASDNDPRITGIGRFLRATRLDELPQVFNVLAGDMSWVGPRPERPFFVKQFEKEIPEYFYRHNVKPGITGMAQVYGRYNTTPANKLIYDLRYIQNCSLVMDMKIILKTFQVLVSKSSTEGVDAAMMKHKDLSRFRISG